MISWMIQPEWITQPAHHDRVVELLERIKRETGEGRVRNIVLYDAIGDPVALLAPLQISEGQNVDDPLASAEGVTILAHEVDGEAVLNFSKRIRRAAIFRTGLNVRDGASTAIGRVEVLLGAEQIAAAQAALASELRRITWIAVGGVTILSFLLARFLTRSIRTLVRDLKAVSQGDLEHRSSVSSSDELGDLARTFNLMTTNLADAQEIKLAQKALENEMAIATEIQTRLLPSAVPTIPGLEIAAHYSPAKEVGGDYYDFIPIDSTHVGIVVADVSGKGVPGSLVMTMTRSLLRMAAAGQPDPKRTLQTIHRTLVPDLRRGLFVTAVYAVVDTSTGVIRLVRAGHNAPVLYEAARNATRLVEPNGVAIGLERSGRLFSERLELIELTLGVDDCLVLYTDGVVEAQDDAGREYGTTRLSKAMSLLSGKTAQEVVQGLQATVRAHEQGRQADDVTLLVLRGGTS